MMEYTTLREPTKKKNTTQAKRKCPSGFRWDSKKGKCVQAGVGPEFKP
tara:strand:- start:170 stop:313 length:144 start_codon:yes stop_codon:yes gene_type:complete